MSGGKGKWILILAILAMGIWGAGRGEAADPIKVGAIFSLSGPLAHNGVENKFIVDYLTAKINREGGINGRPLQVFFYDDESDPTKTVMNFKRLVETDKVAVILGPNGTATCMAIKAQIQKEQVPTFMNVGGDPPIQGGKYGPYSWNFKSPQRSSAAIERVLLYFKKKGITRIATLVDSGGFGMDGKEHIGKIAPKHGLKLVAEEMADPKDTDATPQLARIKSKDAQALLVWAFGPLSGIISKNVKQLGIKIPEIQNHGMAGPLYLSMVGKDGEGVIFVSSKILTAEELPNSDPVKKVNLELVKIYETHKRPIHVQAAYAYDMMSIVLQALRKAGFERAKIREAIEQTRGFVGATGVFNMTPEDHNGLGLDSLVMIQVQGGKWKLIDH